jgi:hypothetical protein
LLKAPFEHPQHARAVIRLLDYPPGSAELDCVAQLVCVLFQRLGNLGGSELANSFAWVGIREGGRTLKNMWAYLNTLLAPSFRGPLPNENLFSSKSMFFDVSLDFWYFRFFSVLPLHFCGCPASLLIPSFFSFPYCCLSAKKLPWSVFGLFTEVYSRYLFTLGDDELYSNKGVFSLEETVRISLVLKVCFYIFF